jgi:hypothetical protein
VSNAGDIGVGGCRINVSVGFSDSSGVVRSASVSPMVRVITACDPSTFGPISTSPPCSIRLCIADELRCEPEGDKVQLPLPPPGTVLAFKDGVSMIRGGVGGSSRGTLFARPTGRRLHWPFWSSSLSNGGSAGVRETIACDPIPSATRHTYNEYIMRSERKGTGRTELNPKRGSPANTRGDP